MTELDPEALEAAAREAAVQGQDDFDRLTSDEKKQVMSCVKQIILAYEEAKQRKLLEGLAMGTAYAVTETNPETGAVVQSYLTPGEVLAQPAKPFNAAWTKAGEPPDDVITYRVVK